MDGVSPRHPNRGRHCSLLGKPSPRPEHASEPDRADDQSTSDVGWPVYAEIETGVARCDEECSPGDEWPDYTALLVKQHRHDARDAHDRHRVSARERGLAELPPWRPEMWPWTCEREFEQHPDEVVPNRHDRDVDGEIGSSASSPEIPAGGTQNRYEDDVRPEPWESDDDPVDRLRPSRVNPREQRDLGRQSLRPASKHPNDDRAQGTGNHGGDGRRGHSAPEARVRMPWSERRERGRRELARWRGATDRRIAHDAMRITTKYPSGRSAQ